MVESKPGKAAVQPGRLGEPQALAGYFRFLYLEDELDALRE